MDDNIKVLIPMIRRVAPTILAQDIIGVQPMLDPFPENSNLYFTTHNDEDGFHAKITITRFRGIHDKLIEINKYIKETFGDRCRNTESNLHYVFENEKDRTLFLLRWSN